MKRLLNLFLLPLLLVGCSKQEEFSERFFSFDTYIEIKNYEGSAENIKELKGIFTSFSKEADNYNLTNINNVYSLNHTSEKLEVSERLFDVLKKSYDLQEEVGSYFNIFVGSLSNKWKEALQENTLLSQETIDTELEKIENTDLIFEENKYVTRVGEGEIDLGAVAKGYVLDLAKAYYQEHNITKYIVNAGRSSLLLGEKNTKDGLFTIKISDLDNKYVEAKNTVISTSSISEQSVVINGVTYSHIVHPETGEVTPLNDAVIVFSKEGLIGDILSTTMMMCSIEEVKSLERNFDVETIVVRDHHIVYQHPSVVIKNG